jgi:hypothetical protein
MPKDATKNVDRYKIRGGHLNEFEYDKNQEALAEQKPKTRKDAIGKKATKAAPAKGASAKKLAARKAAKK